jgi:hypothetical protein
VQTIAPKPTKRVEMKRRSVAPEISLFARYVFLCANCNAVLFTCRDFLQHTKSEVFTDPMNIRCTSFCVRAKDWMVSEEGQQIECYRRWCRNKIGFFLPQGGRCTCGQPVQSCCQIFKSKLKVKGSGDSLEEDEDPNSFVSTRRRRQME